MPQPGKCWRHGIIGTHGSWLPGSPRGWRSRGHRIHTSGDYKHPPREGEHTGLYAFNKARSADAIVIPFALRAVIGKAFRQQIEAEDQRVLAIAVAGTHYHFLAELPMGKREMQAVVGRAKRVSSRSVRDQLPGRVWAAGGRFIMIRDEAYQRRVFEYITGHREEGAWVWSF